MGYILGPTFIGHMINRCSNLTFSYSYSIFRVRTTVRSDIILRCYSYYQSFFSGPLLRGKTGSMNWGGFAVDNSTLVRFFSLHFILPFVIIGIRGVHLLFLHQTGRSNPLGLNRNFDKIVFHPYFSWKDLFGGFILIFFFSYHLFYQPLTTWGP